MFQVLQLKDNREDKLTYLEMFSGLSFGLKITFATRQSSITHLWVVKDDFKESFSDDNHRKEKSLSVLGKVLEPDSRTDGQKQGGLTQDVCINQGDSAGI